MTSAAPRLLYIDDEPGLSRLVQQAFEQGGCIVETVASGAAGIARLSRNPPIDVVTLDHHMSGQDGLDILAEIAALPDPPPVVYVTGVSEGRVAIAALKAGAAAYVIKETGPEFLLLLRAAIDAAIEGRREKQLREKAEAELRESRDRFEALANEREVLIHEVNHRVSNSLQLISSLLQVQSAAQANMQSAQILLDAYKRVAAVARVHKRLYSSADVRYVDLSDYLCSLVEDLRQSADHGGSSLHILSSQTRIATDFAIPIGLVVTELVINAMKYAYPAGGGPIRVKAERSGDLITVQVQDDGIGVGEADWRKSSGIGNRIVLAMAEKIGGALSIAGGAFGTSVTVSFAAADPAPDAETVRDTETSILVIAESLGRDRREASVPDVPPPRLLLVEDDPLMRMVVAGNLEAAGFTVDEAGSGLEARRLWQAGRFAAAIIDIGLPDCRGDQVASEFRNADPHFPIILASGYDEQTIAAGFLGSRFSRALAKPYDEPALLAALEALGVKGLPMETMAAGDRAAPRPA